MSDPPRLARALIALAAAPADRRFILADLAEEFGERAAREGEGRARRWYVTQVLRSLGPCVLGRLRAAANEVPSTRKAGLMDTLHQELRHALRFLRQRPLFTLVASLSIALGVGATTAIFSVANTVLFQPPAGVTEADRVVEVGRTQGGQGFDTFSFPELKDFQREATRFSHLAGVRQGLVSWYSGGEAQQVMAVAVSQPYFGAMGVTPAAGRFFRADEDEVPGAHPVAVLSWNFWQNHFAGDPEIIGRTIDVNREPLTVVGIAPREFNGHVIAIAPEIYIPMTMYGVLHPGFDSFESRPSSFLTIVGRLAPDATLEQADASVKLVMSRHTRVAQDPRNQRSAGVKPLGPVPSGGRPVVAAFLGMLGGLTVIVLLVTCANVAGMLLARGAAREREIAIRLALGSGRARLVRQLVLESMLVFLIGGLAGLLLAVQATSLIGSIELPVPIPLDFDARPDAFVLAAGLGAALLTGIVFGLAPALQASRADLTGAIKQESRRRGARGGRMRRGFVMAQVALSLILLLAAGLFMRSLQRASRIDIGFNPDDVRIVSFDLSKDGYDEADGSAFLLNLQQRVSELPGVTAAGFAHELPLDLGRSETPVFPEGYRSEDDRPWIQSDFAVVSQGYFEAAGIVVRRGRAFDSSDRPGALPVAVVSRTMAERVWPGEDAIGKRLSDTQDGELFTVIGIVDDIKNSTLMDEPTPMLYRPLAQNYRPGLTLLARHTEAGGEGLAERLRETLLDADPRLALSPVQTLESYTSIGVLPQKLAAGITGGLGGLALLLCALGIYGVVAYAVAQRTREIGVRIAVGARSTDVVRLVLRDGLKLALPGLVVGLGLGIALSFLIRGFILGVGPADPLTFSAAALVLLLAVLVASVLPARRAARIEPTIALRSE